MHATETYYQRKITELEQARDDERVAIVAFVQNWYCQNCGGQTCMSCAFREVHDNCANDCPMCCPDLEWEPFAAIARAIGANAHVDQGQHSGMSVTGDIERAVAWDEGYWLGINGHTGPGNPYREGNHTESASVGPKNGEGAN